MMKAILLNGARHNEPDIDTATTQVVQTLAQHSWDITVYTLRDHRISYCTGCFNCWVQTPGECIAKDDNPEIAETIINSDLLIQMSAITFGGYSAEMKRMVDHMIPLLSPFFRQVNGETHHHKRYEQYPATYAIGFLPTPDPLQENIFHRLVQHNAVNFGECQYLSDVWYYTDNLKDIPQRLQQINTLFEEVIA